MQSQQRQKYNLEILTILTDLVTKFPEQRFGQLLYNANIATHLVTNDPEVGTYYKDIFFEESYDTLQKLTGGYKSI